MAAPLGRDGVCAVYLGASILVAGGRMLRSGHAVSPSLLGAAGCRSPEEGLTQSRACWDGEEPSGTCLG